MYRNQPIDLLCSPNLYDMDLRHERVQLSVKKWRIFLTFIIVSQEY